MNSTALPGTELTTEKEMLVFLFADPDEREKGAVLNLLTREINCDELETVLGKGAPHKNRIDEVAILTLMGSTPTDRYKVFMKASLTAG